MRGSVASASADLQRAPLAVGQVARANALAPAQADALEDRRRASCAARSRARSRHASNERARIAGSATTRLSSARVVVEEVDRLERSGDAEPRDRGRRQAGDVRAVEADFAAVGRVHAGQAVEARGLARAVGAHDAGERARLEREVDLPPARRDRRSACADPRLRTAPSTRSCASVASDSRGPCRRALRASTARSP